MSRSPGRRSAPRQVVLVGEHVDHEHASAALHDRTHGLTTAAPLLDQLGDGHLAARGHDAVEPRLDVARGTGTGRERRGDPRAVRDEVVRAPLGAARHAGTQLTVAGVEGNLDHAVAGRLVGGEHVHGHYSSNAVVSASTASRSCTAASARARNAFANTSRCRLMSSGKVTTWQLATTVYAARQAVLRPRVVERDRRAAERVACREVEAQQILLVGAPVVGLHRHLQEVAHVAEGLVEVDHTPVVEADASTVEVGTAPRGVDEQIADVGVAVHDSDIGTGPEVVHREAVRDVQLAHPRNSSLMRSRWWSSANCKRSTAYVPPAE